MTKTIQERIDEAGEVRAALKTFRVADHLTDKQVRLLLTRFKAIEDATAGLDDYDLARRAAINDYNALRDTARFRGILKDFE